MRPGPAVIDTNIVVSGVLTAQSASPTARILDGMLAGRFRFLLSVELLAEYRGVLLRPKIRGRHRLSETEVDILLTEIAANGVALEVGPPVKGRGKAGNDHIWRLLKAEASALLVTGDQKLFDQLEKGTRGLTARSFAELLGG